MILGKFWPYLLALVLVVQIELPTNEFTFNDEVSRDALDQSYQVLPTSAGALSTSKKNSYLAIYHSNNDDSLLTFSKELVSSFTRYYLPVYDLNKPRDFYLII